MSSSFIFALKKFVSVLLVPPTLPFLIVAAGLVLLQRKPRAGKLIAWSGLFVWLFLTSPSGVELITAPLEKYPAVSADQLAQAQAIVILAGGQRRINEEYGGKSTVNRLTLERVRYGARLARTTHLPVLVSGGSPTGYQAEAALMDETLREDFSVQPKWIETQSLDTEDNARFSADILKKAGITRIALVTHAAHMRRAVGEFEATGMQVIPAPLSFMSGGPRGEEFFDYLPSMSSAYTGWYAMHEWFGIAAQKIRLALK